MGAELSREERDRFERLQVEVEALRRELKIADTEERPREHANMLKAEQLRDDLKETVRARDESLHELRDRVAWLEKDARKPPRRHGGSGLLLVGHIIRVGLGGLLGVTLLVVLLSRLPGCH